MALSEKYTAVEAFQAYEQQYRYDLITEAMLAPKTMGMVTAHEGLKGELILTELLVNDIVRRYEKAFGATADQTEYKPVTLRVVKAKGEYSVCPADLENSYLAAVRKRGQDPKDWPFQAFVLDKLFKKIKSEQELAVWNGVAAGSPLSTDKLSALFDGYIEIVKDAITATDVTAEVTGAITATNAVAKTEDVWSGLNSVYKDMPVDIFMAPAGRTNYFLDYRERYGKFTSPMGEDGSYKLDFADAHIHGIAGMPASGIIITPRQNLHWGYDASSDDTLVNFQQMHRQIDMWIDFYIGVQIAMARDGVLAANDQL